MNAEKRTFGMHPNLLFDVILRQAGSLEKAILEGVMNAIDANATKCEITLSPHQFIIEDDGRGIQTKKEIEEFFETFGTPHEDGDAVYGRFRMGRGQMMAYGRNIWRSRQFEMDVDIKKHGLDYQLTEHNEILEGTTITTKLYTAIAPSELQHIKTQLKKFIAYAQIPVFLNGEQFSTPPQHEKWDFEDEFAYYKLTSDRNLLSVYNLGVLVSSNSASYYGMGGTVVSKKALEVNFARNDVQSSCPIFTRIKAFVKRQTTNKTKKSTKLTDAERTTLTREFLAGTLSAEELLKIRVLTDVNGRNWPLGKLAKIKRQFSSRLALSDRGNQFFETAQQRGYAFVIDQSTLERFGTTSLEQFKNQILAGIHNCLQNDHRRSYAWDADNLAIFMKNDCILSNGSDLKGLISEDKIPLREKDLTPEQKLILTALNFSMRILVQILNQINYEDQTFQRREIFLGKSDTALAWTDGTSSIWIDRERAKLIRNGYSGANMIAMDLLHEMLHGEPDTGTHQHDHAFYQAFHDISGHHFDPIGNTAQKMINVFVQQLQAKGKHINRKLLFGEDYAIKISNMIAEQDQPI